MNDKENLIGVIEEITFYNDETGFMVFVINHEDEYITCVGSMPSLSVGEKLKLIGEYSVHNVYGSQFKIDSFEVLVPTTTQDIYNYLSSGVIYGVGPVTASKLVDEFGEDTLYVLSNKPELVASIKGISKKKAEQICESYNEHIASREIMVKLTHFGMTVNQALKVYMAYGNECINIIKTNPYRIIQDINGIGFKIADSIAVNVGISKDSVYRIAAGIEFALLCGLSNGHMYLPFETLINKSCEILECDSSMVIECIDDMQMSGSIINYEDGIYLAKYYQAEVSCARHIAMLSTYGRTIENAKELVENGIKNFPILLSNEQKLAVEMAVKYPCSVITGGPGTGKTTIIKLVMDIFEQLELKVFLCAPTGRAAKRMAQATDMDSFTIHRLLEYTGEGCFMKNENSPIDADVIIVDEMSMVDVMLMSGLIRAVPSGAKLICIGDKDQLMSVGAGCVLKDMIDSDILPVSRLCKIYRQGDGSEIALSAAKINKGEIPALKPDGDLVFAEINNPRDMILKLKQYFRVMKNRVDPKVYRDIQVLCPAKKGEAGVLNINKELQEVINPKNDALNERRVGDVIFRVNDKVMQIKNNYNIEWKDIYGNSDMGVFNGDIGFIRHIDNDREQITVVFDEQKIVDYAFSDLDQLMHAYCLTVHKSQGSEFDTLLFVVSGPRPLMSRNLLYTGVTRAKNKLYLLGTKNAIEFMIQNNRVSKRYSNLKQFLEIEKERV